MGNKLSDEELLKELNEAGLYTISQLQTSGQAAVHWDNITNKEAYVNSFLSLNDVLESTYAGKAGYRVIVNPTATGLVFLPDSGDAREIELQNDGTNIQWRYSGETEWNKLVALVDITGNAGIDGTDGSDAPAVQYEYREADSGWTGTANSFTGTEKWIRVSLDGGTTWSDSIKFVGEDGIDGSDVEFQNNGTYIQWKYVDDISWTNLVALADITGDDGYTPIKDVDYFDGTNGVGISSIVRTSGYGSPGTTDTYTITYTDTSTTTFNVYNGADGTNGTDGYSLYVLNYDPTTEGNDGDSWLNYTDWDFFKKAGGVWGSVGNIKGDSGTDGIDGDQWTYSTDNPSDLDAKTYDSFHINTITNHIWYKAESVTTWSDIFTIAGDKYYSTATNTINLSTYVVGDTITLTVPSGMSYSIGQFLVVANSTSLYFVGKVISYSGTSLQLELRYKLGNSSASSWTINLAGITEAESNVEWYKITATAGTGTISSRVFTAPSGWTVGASNTITVTGLGSNAVDLTIKHDTGYEAIDCVVFANDGTKYTKLQTPVSYATMYEDLTHIAVELASFCTLQQALVIYLKLQ